MNEKKISLRDRLNTATSKREIEELLSEGASYKFASGTTKRRWLRTAKVRLAELEDGTIEG